MSSAAPGDFAGNAEFAAGLFGLDLEEADRLALGAAVLMSRLALPIARAAASFCGRRGWHVDGFANAHDYARERLGRSGAWLRGMARIGRGAQEWPRLELALLGADGAEPLNVVAAEWICRVATEETVEQWIALARQSTVRVVKDQVTAARQAGSAAPLVDVPLPAPEEDWDDDPDGDRDYRTRLDFPACPAVKEGFAVGFDQHQAVVGQRVSVLSYVEALVAEYSGRHGWAEWDWLPEFERAGLHRATRTEREREHPPRQRFEGRSEAGEDELFSAAREKIKTAWGLLRRRVWPDAREAGWDLRDLLKLERELRHLLGRLLAVLGSGGGWRGRGFVDLGQYAEERLGIARTTAQDLAQAARFAARHPAMAEQYEEGEIPTRQAVLLARELGMEVEEEALEGWLTEVQDSTVKRLEDALRWRRRQLGLGKLKKDEPPNTPVWRASISRTRRAYRRQLEECQAAMEENPEATDVLRLWLPPELALRLLGTLCQAQAEAEGVPVEVVQARVDLLPRLDGRRTLTAFLVSGIGQEAWLRLLQEYVDEWQPADSKAGRETHFVVQRDGYRCTAPGCTARRGLERHHIEFLSQYGDRTAPENQTTLCWHHHHRGVHDDTMMLRGMAPMNLHFRMGDRDHPRYYINDNPAPVGRGLLPFFNC